MTNSDSETSICPIWGTSTSVPNKVDPNGDTLVDSPRAGGRFRIKENAKSAIKTAGPDLKAKLTTWLIEQRLSGDTEPMIRTDVVESVKQREFLTYAERRDNFFKFVNSLNPRVGETVESSNKQLAAWIEHRPRVETCNETSQVIEFMELMQEAGYVKKLEQGNWESFKLTAKGWEYLGELSRKKRIGNEAFVAMWFDPSLDEVFENQIEPALIECGYNRPFRIDQEEHSDKIDDAIIAKINKASLVIVDFTCNVLERAELEKKIVEARGGVYFEAGYAMGLGIPIIWTCRSDCVSHIHFDLRQYNQIVWQKNTHHVDGLNDKMSFKDALINRISALRLNRNER